MDKNDHNTYCVQILGHFDYFRHFMLILSLISALFPLYKTIGKICFGLHNYPCLSQNTV